MSVTKPSVEQEKDLTEEIVIQEPPKVVLFNDELHTFDEVIHQIVKATGCAYAKAEALTWQVHNAGKAVVYQGELPRCMEVSGVLEEIELMTQIEV